MVGLKLPNLLTWVRFLVAAPKKGLTMKHVENVIIGKLMCAPCQLFAMNSQDWIENEQNKTLFTNERFLPKLMVECGLVNSISEVRRNQPALVRTLNSLDFIEIKWGKKKLFMGVGE